MYSITLKTIKFLKKKELNRMIHEPFLAFQASHFALPLKSSMPGLADVFNMHQHYGICVHR